VTNKPAKKIELVRKMVAQVPRFAPAWKDFANTRDTGIDKLQVIERGLAAEPES
jgi:hypothetical protein